MNNKIYFVDVTNRDGVQTSRLGLAKLEKTIINLMLDDMGITQSEFGFPTTSHEINYLNGNLELVERNVITKTKLSGWMRGIASDVELSFKNVPKLKHLNLSQSTSEQMIHGKYMGKKTFHDIINMTCEAVECAVSKGAQTIGVNAEDASRSDISFLIKYALEAKKCGAHRFRYCDTLGYEDPKTAYDRIYTIAKETQMPIEVHYHNDLGMAAACSVMGAKAAIDAGVDAYINTAINGMGERAGNADLVSCLLAILKSAGFKNKYKVDENIDLSKIWKLAKYTAYAFRVPIPINQPAVGDNAFAHESGIHADGALKDRRNYELYDFEELGRGKTSCRGHNGEGQRSGSSSKRGFEGGQMPSYRRLPKLKGFQVYKKPVSAEINVGRLAQLGMKEVCLACLIEAGKAHPSSQLLRILGNGEIKEAITVKANYFTPSAKEKIEKAGGKVELV